MTALVDIISWPAHLVTRAPDGRPFLDRSVSRVRGALARGAARWPGGRSQSETALPSVTGEALIAGCLSEHGGELAARGRAAELGRHYLESSAAERAALLRLIAERFGSDRGRVDALLQAALAAPTGPERERALAKLRLGLRTPRVELFRRFSTMPGGMRFLVDLRSDVRRWRKDCPELAALDNELKALLSDWFDLGLLVLERIDWNAPAPLLEKLIAYEAVHPIEGWADLKDRLDRDRRLFALFHPQMPQDPLIFVEVALTRGLAGRLVDILDQGVPVTDPQAADTAIFYSISNAHDGLAGIPFGSYLIKLVMAQLSSELPGLQTFATLSPIPGFRAWLASAMRDAEEQSRLQALLGRKADLAIVVNDLPNYRPPDEDVLERLVADYLVRARAKDGRPLDSVARFHLGNGAQVERINPRADTSFKAWEQSAGMMVNYLYETAEIEANVDAYRNDGIVAMSSAVRHLLRG
jgi:malonyl-CoA decarboxylase